MGEKLSNYSLVITATAKSAGFLANTTMTAQVSVAVLTSVKSFTSRCVKLISVHRLHRGKYFLKWTRRVKSWYGNNDVKITTSFFVVVLFDFGI